MKEAEKRLAHLSFIYQRLLDEVSEISKMASIVVERYSLETLLGFLDEALQASLISVAITDGEYREIDHKLIKNLCRYGDIVRAHNEENPDLSALDWDSLYDSIRAVPISKKAVIASRLACCACERGDRLTQALAIASCGFYKDFYPPIKRRLRWTVLAFVNATTPQGDKELKDAKLRMGMDMLDMVFLKSWRENYEIAKRKNVERVEYDKMVADFFEYNERIEDEAEARGEELDPSLNLTFEEYKEKWLRGEKL